MSKNLQKDKKAVKPKKSDAENGDDSESEGEGTGSDEDDATNKSKNESDAVNTGDPIKIEKKRILNEISLLKAKTNEQMFEEILDFLECHDQVGYRKKIKGFRLAFNIREKSYRIPEGSINKDKKPRSKKSAEEIKNKVKNMRNNRMTVKKEKEENENKKYLKNRNLLKRMHEKLRNEKY